MYTVDRGIYIKAFLKDQLPRKLARNINNNIIEFTVYIYV
jgi:hypothetical protein